jgi:hypothetical protein
MATMRNLPDSHPVYELLRRHFRYTLAINEGARQGLLAEGGVFDDFIATGGPDKGHLQLRKKGFLHWKLTDNKPRQDLERRGVLDPAVLPYYPYRDDALALWDAIEEYVGGCAEALLQVRRRPRERHRDAGLVGRSHRAGVPC